MLTSFISKFSLFTSLVTLIYCIVIDVSFGESFFRAMVVFVGFYVTLVLFFIALRMLLNPKPKQGTSIE